MMNLNTSSGLTAFFSQDDVTDLMVIDEELTVATAPLRDELAAFNTSEATFHYLCVVHLEPLSLRLTSSLVELHDMDTERLMSRCRRHVTISSTEEATVKRQCCKYHLRIEPPLHALVAATDSMTAAEYQAAIAALKRVKLAASKTVVTTMGDLTSSSAMTGLTGVAALPHHIKGGNIFIELL
jgi:hypothetical protein